MCGFSPHTTKQSSDTSQGFCNWTQFWRDLPGGSIGSRSLRAASTRLPPTSDASGESRLSPVLRIHGCRLDVSMTSFLGSIHLLEWLTKLRETFYFLDSWFITKGCNSGAVGWKSCTGPGMWEGLPCPPQMLRSPLIPTLLSSPRVHRQGNSLNPVILSFDDGFITKARLIKSLASTSDSISSTHLSGGQGRGTERSHLPS